MLVLFETPAGFAIFKLLDEKKLQKSDNLFEDFATPEGAKKVVKLKMFEKFKDTTDALASAAALIEGKMSKGLKKLMKKIVASDSQETLAVADAKLGNVIKSKTDLDCVYSSNVMELMRCIRSQMPELVAGGDDKEMTAMSLGLAHSLSRYKLKFSPDKIDTMIVQAVSLLDDLDKELNNYIMRAREWYGWHFPEMGKIVTDNLAYVRTVQAMGMRENASQSDLSDILPEEVESAVKEAAEISMGTEISEIDLINIKHLCMQVVEIQEYREQLWSYLKNRMVAIAPNLTTLVGELVGARLISHAGSLMNLAKHPASTVQILGAEKALFKALKTKHDTPKYGLIYHAQLVGQTTTALKGKVSRMLAAKASLACRVDAFSEDTTSSIEIGMEQRLKVEARINQLEGGNRYRVSGTGKEAAKFNKYESKGEVLQYKTAADNTMAAPQKRKLIEEISDDKKETSSQVGTSSEGPKKKKKKKEKDTEIQQDQNVKTTEDMEDGKAAEIQKKTKKKGKDNESKLKEEENKGTEKSSLTDPDEKKVLEEKCQQEEIKVATSEMEKSNSKDSKKKKKKKEKDNSSEQERIVATSGHSKETLTEDSENQKKKEEKNNEGRTKDGEDGDVEKTKKKKKKQKDQ